MQTQIKQQPEKQVAKKQETLLTQLTTNSVKTVWSNPVGKFVLVTGAGVVTLFALGWLFRLLAWVKAGFNQFQSLSTKALPPAQAKA